MSRIKVELLSKMDIAPESLISFAARTCYKNERPQIGDHINIPSSVFNPGHHTTLQHSYFTFFIEGISIGDITSGLHLNNSFYNSDQRSGRFCNDMFANPDIEQLINYIKSYWTQITETTLNNIRKYLKSSLNIYQENLAKAISIAEQFIIQERSLASQKFIERNSKKFAQEQLRVFIPVIFPTANTYTINLSTIIAMRASAWSPVLKDIFHKMINLITERYSELDFIQRIYEDYPDWGFPLLNGNTLKEEPSLKILKLNKDEIKDFLKPNAKEMHPVDLSQFHPKFMNNKLIRIENEVELSLATMGQDQRHRTINRSIPNFTGDFYLPPIVKACNIPEEKIMQVINQWKDLSTNIPNSLRTVLAPYGAIVKYKKEMDLNGLAHEQAKRLCWAAQEEIYYLGVLFRKEIPKESKLLKIFQPPCYQTGICAEGKRYCKRDITKRLDPNHDYFPRRKV